MNRFRIKKSLAIMMVMTAIASVRMQARQIARNLFDRMNRPLYLPDVFENLKFGGDKNNAIVGFAYGRSRFKISFGKMTVGFLDLRIC